MTNEVLVQKILELLDDEDRRKRMSEFGRKRIVEELSWEHTSQALLKGYDEYFRSRGK